MSGYGPGPRRSALTPLGEDDDDDASQATPRRSALTPIPDDDASQATPRRSALTPIPDEDDTDAVSPRRSALSPDHDQAPEQRPLPTLSASDEPVAAPDSVPQDENGLVAATSAPDPYVQPTLPELTPTPSWPPVAEAATGPLPLLGDPQTWAVDDDTHVLFRRPAPGEPETQWEMSPISAGEPEDEVAVSPPTPATAEAKTSDTSRSRRATKPVRAKSARRGRRNHRRLFTVLALVVGFLLLVGVGGYIFTRLDPTLGGVAQGDLTLPLAAGDYRRDPAQGTSPSVHPDSKISTVSATYSLDGVQQFVVIAYRPQTSPQAALAEIQARSVTTVAGGACGRTADQALACVVISGTTAVLAVTLVDQNADDLIAAAQKVAEGLGRG